MPIITKSKVGVSKQVFKLVQKPTPVCHIGEGKVNKISDILKMNNVKRVLLIASKSVVKLGLLDTMMDLIKSEGINIFMYNGVKPDPTFAIVEEALKICKDNKCEAIVAIGGGSVIDTAKVVSVSYTNNKPPKDFEGLLKVKKIGLPFIAVPTTAGTGSETTLVSVISDTITHKKTTVIDPKIVPNVAILDPQLTLDLPLSITAHTAMDALTHAVEAYVSTYATDEADKYAEIAIKLIYDSIEKLYKNPKDIKLREDMLVASFYAGMAFTRTFVGYVHAFAHNIGGKFGVSHGLANAVLLPHVMKSYLPTCENRFARLADLLEIGNKNDSNKKKAELFVSSIFELNRTLNIPERLDKFDKKAVSEICQAGFKECHGTYPVPYYYSKKEGEEILFKVCNEE